MIGRNSDIYLTLIGGCLGGFFGMWADFLTMLDEGPSLNPINTVITYSQPSIPNFPARLDVYLIDNKIYSRTAPKPSDFNYETTVLYYAVPAAVVVVCTLCGLLIGGLPNRLRSTKRPISKGLPD
jgi:hypothetical protein